MINAKPVPKPLSKYRKYLEELMVKEAEDTSFVDEANQREFEKVQKARDDALQAKRTPVLI